MEKTVILCILWIGVWIFSCRLYCRSDRFRLRMWF